MTNKVLEKHSGRFFFCYCCKSGNSIFVISAHFSSLRTCKQLCFQINLCSLILRNCDEANEFVVWGWDGSQGKQAFESHAGVSCCKHSRMVCIIHSSSMDLCEQSLHGDNMGINQATDSDNSNQVSASTTANTKYGL